MKLKIYRALWMIAVGMTAVSGSAFAQEHQPMVRLSKVVVAPSQLAAYKAALTDEIKASIKLEPGVKTLYAVSDKDHPEQFTILEIYADRAAYESHVRSPHFLKYKVGTKSMVKSLELVDTVPLIPGMKIK